MENKKSTKEIVKSIDLEIRSNKYICDWGIRHKENKPNESEPNEETNRTEFRRERDRILYTGGFRRLQGKTQVIAASKNGDHRTRLTHSLEVEQIAVSIADALSLNRDLVSAIALGHDVGHTPFGHAVERFLNEKLKDKGGFSHAVQSVRYLNNKNLNLSDEVLEGILKHDTDVYVGSYNKEQFDCTKYNPSEPGSLEAQVVYWSDKLAYLTHDFEDFYKEIYKKDREYGKKLEPELKQILEEIIPGKKAEISKDLEKNFKTRDLVRSVLRNLINESSKNINELEVPDEGLMQDVIKMKTKERISDMKRNLRLDELTIEQIEERISEIKASPEIEDTDKEYKISDMRDKIKKLKKEAYQKGLIINFEEDYGQAYFKLRKFLDKYYLGSPVIQRSDAKAEKIVEALYNDFINKPKILPLNIQNNIDLDQKNLHRVVADYIACMTDRYAEEVFINLNSVGSYYHD